MKAWLLQQLESRKLSFRRLEAMVFEGLMNTFRDLMAEILEGLDKSLAAHRDTSRYELKERNTRKVETLLGPVTFRRRYYRDRAENRWVHLLDEHLSLEPWHRISPGLCELATLWASKGSSYRDARDRLADVYGAQAVSHEAIRQMVQQVAAGAERTDRNAIIRDDGRGKRRVRALFIEADGLFAALQRPGLPRKAHGRRCEPKVAVIHEGWEVRQGRGNRKDYRLVNPVYIPKLTDAESFWEHVRAQAALRYEDIDRIPVIINGDEAGWIRQGAEVFGRGMYQYDRFHFVRSLRHALRHRPRDLKRALAAWRADDMGQVESVVVGALREAPDPKTAEDLASVHRTLIAHREALRDYRIRLEGQGCRVDPSWRTMGAAESNVDNFKNRLRKRGRAWSIGGLQAILTCLGKLFEGTLPSYVSRHLAAAEEWPLDRVQTPGSLILRQQLPPEPPIRKGNLPAMRHGTQGFAKLFRQVAQVNPQLL